MTDTYDKKPPSFKTQGPPTITITASTPLTGPIKPEAVAAKKNSIPVDTSRATAADTSVMNPIGENSLMSDTFLDLEDEGEEGMDTEENADMYLNLDNIEDVEMSSDSTKRKRVEEGEECTSCP